MIDGVNKIPLKQIPDQRGKVMHMLKCTDAHFQRFGEVYFSVVFPNVVKGWHLHKAMTLNYACVYGNIRLVIYDDRKGSKTRGVAQEFVIGEDDYSLVVVPPLVWNAFKGISSTPSIVANCATIPHDPDEIMRKDPFTKDIPYEWF